jgi:hypothetical protein
MNLQEQKNKIDEKIALLAVKANISEDEVKELQALTAQSVALKAQISAQAQIAEDEKAKKAEAEKAQQTAIDAAVKAESERKDKEFAAKGRRLPFDGAPYQAQYSDIAKFDNLSPDDHAFMVGILGAAKKKGYSENGITPESLKSLAIKLSESKEEYHLPAKRAMKASGLPMDGLALKANELNYSTYSSYGDEWVHTLFSSRLWEKIRNGVSILANIPTVEVPQGAESITIPVQGTSMSFYKVAQATAQDTNNKGQTTRTVPTSKMGTPTNAVLSVGKLGGGTTYTGELEEDSIIPWAATLRADSELEAQEVLESLIIDGDTETGATTNINDIGGTPDAADYFLLFDGFRKLALVTNTGNSKAGGALTVDSFLDAAKMLGLAGRNAFQKDKVAFITDAWTSWKALQLPEVQNRDVFSSPTIENGVLTGLWGYKVMSSTNMHRWNADTTYGLKANSAGKIDLDTVANNLYGSLLAVRWDQWQFGYKRRITFEAQRVPRADATEITVLMRVGMVNRDTEASSIVYGLNV